MTSQSEREAFLIAFHARHPGITSRALARAGSYERLADRIAPPARVLDLGCGDGHLVDVLAARGCRAVGIDLSRDELAHATAGTCVRGRAQALPFATGAFDAAVSHFAFMLLDDVEHVVAELARVVVPGGRFVAVLGGGPRGDTSNPDEFHRFLSIVQPHLAHPIRLGDPRAKSERGWRELFAAWRDVAFERAELDLSGTLDEVWQFLGASYELAMIDDRARELVRARFAEHISPHGRLMCRAVMWIATALR